MNYGQGQGQGHGHGHGQGHGHGHGDRKRSRSRSNSGEKGHGEHKKHGQGGNRGNNQGGNWGNNQGGNWGNNQGGNRGNNQGGNWGNNQGGNNSQWTQQRDEQLRASIDAVFAKYDRDQSCFLNQPEFCAAYNEVCGMLSIQPIQDQMQMQQIAISIDKDSNGQITKMELFNAIKSRNP